MTCVPNGAASGAGLRRLLTEGSYCKASAVPIRARVLDPLSPAPEAAPFGTQVTICLQFKPMRTMDGVARCARGLETRGNDGYGGAVTPEVRGRTALESRAISK